MIRKIHCYEDITLPTTSSASWFSGIVYALEMRVPGFKSQKPICVLVFFYSLLQLVKRIGRQMKTPNLKIDLTQKMYILHNDLPLICHICKTQVVVAN